MKTLIRRLAASLLICYSAGASAQSKVKVTIEVVDEAGNPVPEADVGIGTIVQGKAGSLRGKTDREGKWTAEPYSYDEVGGSAKKEGYYRTGYSIKLYKLVPEGVTVGRKFPDVTHRVTIRPKVKPVPMYAYALSRTIPVEGEEIGLDLLKADWVAPHGKGEVADVLVKSVKSADSGPTLRYGTFLWRFPRKGDGMVRVGPEDCYPDSDFVMPRSAPEIGYVSEWQAKRKLVDGKRVTEMKPDGPWLGAVPYFFRIRTDLDEKGLVGNALYGKIIQGNYSIGWSSSYEKDGARVSFTYYINPDGTRNMEFDPEKNLFKDIMPYQERHNWPRWP